MKNTSLNHKSSSGLGKEGNSTSFSASLNLVKTSSESTEKSGNRLLSAVDVATGRKSKYYTDNIFSGSSYPFHSVHLQCSQQNRNSDVLALLGSFSQLMTFLSANYNYSLTSYRARNLLSYQSQLPSDGCLSSSGQFVTSFETILLLLLTLVVDC